jgi:hypothetical protein
MLDWFYGARAGGHHLTRVALHALATVALLAALGADARPWRAPSWRRHARCISLRVESVAWVSERGTCSRRSAGGGTVRLRALGGAAEPRALRRGGDEMIAAGHLATALFEGVDWGQLETADPFVYFGDDLAPFVLEKLPLFALSAAAAAVTFLVQSSAGAVASLEHQPFGMRAANAVVAYATYVWKTIWPTGLAVFYPPVDTFAPGAVLAALAVLVARARSPVAAADAAVPPSGGLVRRHARAGDRIVRVGDQSMADRSRTSRIGLAVMVARAARSRGVTRSRTMVTGVVVPVLAAWCVRTGDRWRRGATAVTSTRTRWPTTDNHARQPGLLLLDEHRA